MERRSEFGVRLAQDLKERGLGPLAAFLVRANWPLATIYANIVMGAEPFLAMAYNIPSFTLRCGNYGKRSL